MPPAIHDIIRVIMETSMADTAANSSRPDVDIASHPRQALGIASQHHHIAYFTSFPRLSIHP